MNKCCLLIVRQWRVVEMLALNALLLLFQIAAILPAFFYYASMHIVNVTSWANIIKLLSTIGNNADRPVLGYSNCALSEIPLNSAETKLLVIARVWCGICIILHMIDPARRIGFKVDLIWLRWMMTLSLIAKYLHTISLLMYIRDWDGDGRYECTLVVGMHYCQLLEIILWDGRSSLWWILPG